MVEPGVRYAVRSASARQPPGTTSITVRVEVFAQRPALCVKVTEAVIVYVAVDGEGQRRPLPEHEPAFQSVYG